MYVTNKLLKNNFQSVQTSQKESFHINNTYLKKCNFLKC